MSIPPCVEVPLLLEIGSCSLLRRCLFEETGCLATGFVDGSGEE